MTCTSVKGIAELPFDTKERLHRGHTVAMWAPVAKRLAPLSRFFCIPPFRERPDFPSPRLGRERVDLLWLVPITEAEHEFLQRHGSQALTGIFAAHRLSIVLTDVERHACRPHSCFRRSLLGRRSRPGYEPIHSHQVMGPGR